MAIDGEKRVDLVTIDSDTGDLLLAISDHLPWEKDEDIHLLALQNKLNAYLAFIESGELQAKVPDAAGRAIIINVVGKFALSEQASRFFQMAQSQVEEAGFKLCFEHLHLT